MLAGNRREVAAECQLFDALPYDSCFDSFIEVIRGFA
jgi:hypothetical protein